MKAATQAWYWLAAGVLALGLNGYYQDGGLQQIHRLADSAESTIVESRVHFSQAATLAEVTFAERPRCERQAPFGAVTPMIPQHAQARLAELQERMGEMRAARVQARIARLQQVLAQRELQRAQVEWQDGRLSVVNNAGKVEMELPTLPRVEVNVPQEPVIEEAQPN